MKGGESAHNVPEKKSFRELRNSNLFNPWALSPELTERQFKAIQHIDKRLEKFRWYQGISVFGSTMFGYSRVIQSGDSEKDSDIDIFPLVDFNEKTFVYNEVRATLRALEYEVFDTYHLQVNFQNLVNISRMHDEVSDATIKAPQVNMAALEALSYWTTQNGTESNPGRVRKWLSKYRKLCGGLTPRVRETLKRNLVERLVDRDLGRESKIEDRIAGYKEASDPEKLLTLKARRKLWSHRVSKLFGL